MHQALYRKYRPAAFSDVVGQEHVTSVLKYEVAGGRASHAYLFCGSRGTGKTTCAKILSKAVNCLDPQNGDPCCKCENCVAIEKGWTTDVMEMDAASNTGVDYIRDIRDAVMYAPSMLSTRVYIIDEVHMLSDGAFNALLKTLEEPPSGVIFILATTEMQKIPSTILSRCPRFEFRRIAGGVIGDRLLEIAEKEGIALEKEAAHLIARLSQGGMRDAISMLELCSADGRRVDKELVESLSGGAGRQMIEKTVEALANKDRAALLSVIARLYESSGDLSVFWQELIAYYRDMIVVKTIKDMDKEDLRQTVLDLTESEYEKLTALSERFRYETLMYHSNVLDGALASTGGKTGASGRIAAEMALMKMSCEAVDASPQALLARIAALEDRLNAGLIAAYPSKDLKTAEVLQASKKEETTEVQASETEQKGRVLDCYAEVLSAFARIDPGTAAFLNGTDAILYPDGRLLIEVGNEFALRMVESNNGANAIGAILKNSHGVDARVTFFVKKGKSKGADMLDELS